MKLGKILVIAVVAVLAVGAGIGGTLGLQKYLPHIIGSGAAAAAGAGTGTGAGVKKSAAAAAPAHPQPLYFADLSDVVVSIPPQTGAPATSYVEFGIQFSTFDPNAVTNFGTYQPIVKSEIINLLMNETSAALQDPKVRTGLIQNCLDIANSVMMKNASSPTPPFTAAYITNLVVQD
jgi:flagellar basal body-associated protein FliL